ncbi:hypothetical protein [Chryseobacterium herbae]|uniref:DUF4468 domain-containing protein n=1 Tax=Chryseobacterium herbae TaxID=2976476 RepID=A0ABT2IW30_9FLAO|nr:hypothetical protein [Chryseobacterium sp. pc1-10]MCT2562525.1 hypothetical protein [Chryseobacterium sp. pc1-10]
MTRQLKLAIVLLVTVASMGLNAQKKTTAKSTKPSTENKTAKPTKQETMDWIAGKLKENLATYNDRTFVSYQDGIFVYRSQYAGPSKFCEYSYDLNKVTGMKNEYSDFFVSGNKQLFAHCDYDRAGEGNYYNYISISGPNYNKYRSPFNFGTDQALVERLEKAFQTLVEYNSTKKGADEKF